MSFQVRDDGGTANSGVDLDASANTMTINVTSVNDAPSGTNKTVTTLKDINHTFIATDFGFSDADGNAFLSVRITTLPGLGTLRNNGVVVNAGDFVLKSDIDLNRLVWSPVAGGSGTNYASFTFQVRDDGGTANGGIDLDASANTITIDVHAVNEAPSGTNTTVTTLEDTAYTFTAADFGFSDIEGNGFLSVRVTTLPGLGTLRNNGVVVNAGDYITKADIDLNRLVWTPVANANGTGYASFTFQVRDDGGTANGGVDLDASANTMTIDVTSVNDTPSGTNTTVTTLEDTAYTFTAADFGFSDADSNAFLSVRITTLLGLGTLCNNGVVVNAGDYVTKADIDLNRLVWTAIANSAGTGYASFTFQVRDDGGTANGGVDLDASANTLTIDVTAVNDAPSGTNTTVTTLENTAYTFTAADFGFSDADSNAFQSVRITTLPGLGTLRNNGVVVNAGDYVTKADIDLNRLVWTPVANASGSGYVSFTFQVRDDGGTANGGVDLDASVNTMTIDVTSVNDAPSGTNNTVTTNEDTAYTFTAADFGFSDADGNALSGIKISAAPSLGSLLNNGAVLGSGGMVSKADIDAGRLVWVPVKHAKGVAYTSFSFQVVDDGGTNNGGADLDASPKTMTINVSGVNHAPSGADKSISLLQDNSYTFSVADFGFNDPDDVPGNNLLSVKITSLSGSGVLTNKGVAVAAGDFILKDDINLGHLVFTPATRGVGSGYAGVVFQLMDDGGVLNGGVNLDASPNTLTINIAAVNHAPSGSNTTITTVQDRAYTFSASDFGFADSGDTPANNLLAVKISSLPNNGLLRNNGALLSAGDFILRSDIDQGRLIWTPASGGYGTAYASFSFQVKDNGGTANGGVDLDAVARTVTFNVTKLASAGDSGAGVGVIFPVNSGNNISSGASNSASSSATGNTSSSTSSSTAGSGSSIGISSKLNGETSNSLNNGKSSGISGSSTGSTISDNAEVGNSASPGDTSNNNEVSTATNNVKSNKVANKFYGGHMAHSLASSDMQLSLVDVVAKLNAASSSPATSQTSSFALIQKLDKLEIDALASRVNVMALGQLSILQQAATNKKNSSIFWRSDSRSSDDETRFTEGVVEEKKTSRPDGLTLATSEIKMVAALTSIGAAMWALKQSTLLASLVASVPVWQRIDPLNIVAGDDSNDALDEDGQMDIADHMFSGAEEHKMSLEHEGRE